MKEKNWPNFSNDLINNISKILKSGKINYTTGPYGKIFENEFSKFVGNKYSIAICNGTAALEVAIKSLKLPANSEIIVTARSFFASAACIINTGHRPVFADVDMFTQNICLNDVKKKITKKTKAIIPVNLYGQSANYKEIRKICNNYKIKIIEDCAQSAGALYNNKPSGSLGDLAAFSFYPTKNLGGYGDGGMIVTNSNSLFKTCKKLRKYGMTKNYYSEIHGINSRLDEIQAAILNFHLTKLRSNIIKRRKIAKIYNENLKTNSLILPIENIDNYHSYYVYVVRHPQRKKIMDYLRKNNIFCNISYPFPIHSMKGYRYLNIRNNDLKITNKLSKEIFSLPMYPELSTIKLEKIINVLNKF